MRTSRSWTSWNPPIGLPHCVRSVAERSACSYAPIWQPTANHATPVRVILRTLAVSLNELAFCRRSDSGTRHSLRVIKPFCTTRNAILVLIFSTEKPGFSFATTKPLTWFEPSSRAQITLMSAKVAFPIHFFWPLRIQLSPSRRHVVIIPPDVADPTSGSVKPKEPILSKRIIGGSQRCFCASSPHREIDPAERPVCTPQNVATD